MAKDRSELLLTHYEATVESFRRDVKIRGQIGFGMLFVVLLLLFRAQTPDLVEGWVESWIRMQTAIEQAESKSRKATPPPGTATSSPDEADPQSAELERVDFDFLTTVVWFVLSSLLILYFRWSLILERQGAYLRRLEGRLADAAGGPIATRFRDLQRNRPLFFRVAQHLYSFMMMAMLIAGASLVLYWEFTQADPSRFRWIDLTIFCLLIVFGAIFSYDILRAQRPRRRGSGPPADSPPSS